MHRIPHPVSPSHGPAPRHGRVRFLALVLSLLAGAVLLLAPGTVQAQQTAGATQGAASEEPGRFGVGFQSSWPAYGLSGTYAVNERITAQGVLGAFGSLTTVSARGLYHFQQEEKYSLYGFGTVGVWRHSFRFLGVSESETSPGVGGGAGIELDWRRLLDSGGEGSGFPPLFSTIDLGFVAASFDNYSFSGLVIGAGIHYRF